MASVSKTSKENLEIQAELDKKADRKRKLGVIIPYMGLIFCLVFFTAVTGGKFISGSNLSNLVEQCFSMVVVAVGASFVYAQGNMDFSIGSACGVAQMVGGIIMTRFGLPLPIVLLAIIVVPVLSCTLVSTISALFKVPVFIGSMCIRSLLAGLLTIGVSKSEILIPISNYPLFNSGVFKILMLVVIIGIGAYLFYYTRVGIYAKLIGGNRTTASQTGIKVIPNIFRAYVILGICVGIASIFSMFRSGTVSAQSGSGLEFNMMLAIVLGGFPMEGGEKARLTAAIVGGITATLLTNGLSVWGLDPNLIGGIKGLIFIVIIALTYDRSAGKLVS